MSITKGKISLKSLGFSASSEEGYTLKTGLSIKTFKGFSLDKSDRYEMLTATFFAEKKGERETDLASSRT
ncbi:MAG: hypothetical protein WA915_06675, partial [Candidatus Aminicenantaceae bacterium]